MQLTSIWASALVLWVVTHFWLLPISRDQWRASSLHQKVARAATLVLLEKIRDLSFVAATTMAAIMLLVLSLDVLAVGSITASRTAIVAITGFHTVLADWVDEYRNVIGILGLLGAALALLLIGRHARARITDAWAAKSDEVRVRLLNDPSALEGLRADPELGPSIDRIDLLTRELHDHLEAAARGEMSENRLEGARQRAHLAFDLLVVDLAARELDIDTALATRAPTERREPSSFLGRVARILAGDRLGRDLGLIRKPLSRLVTALLVVSLVGWSAEPLANSSRLAINNLAVNLLDKEAERDLAATVAELDWPELPEDRGEEAGIEEDAERVSTAARIVARAVVSELLGAKAFGANGPPLAKAELVRAALNGKTLYVDDSPRLEAELRKTIAQEVALAGTEPIDQLRRHVEAEVRSDLEGLSKTNPSGFRRWVDALERYDGAVRSPLDAQGMLMGHLLEEAVGSVDTRPATELGRQVQAILQDVGKEALETWLGSYAKAWLNGALIDAARPSVIESVSAHRFQTSARVEGIFDRLTTKAGTGWVAPADWRAMEDRATELADLVARQPDFAGRHGVRDALSGYDNHFPPSTPPAEEGGGGSGGGGGTPSPRTGPSSDGRSFAQARATSVRMAARSSISRGVLIGHDHEAVGITLTDIRWSLRPGAPEGPTMLALAVNAGGDWRDIGVFRAGVANQALRYAADGRVVAATILPGDGVIIRRVIHLHPVLADTPLGCRMVEADRIIDTITGPAEGGDAAARTCDDRLYASSLVGAASFVLAHSNHDGPQRCESQGAVELCRNPPPAPWPSQSLAAQIDEFLAGKRTQQPGSTHLIDGVRDCIGTSAISTQCLCGVVPSIRRQEAVWHIRDHTSQVREREAKLDAGWAWLQPSADHLGHLDFWLHITVAQERRDSYGRFRTDQTTEDAIDFPQDQIAALRDRISLELRDRPTRFANSRSIGDFMGPIEEFVLLQRLFRATLSGRFGDHFPLEKLIALERETRRFVPPQATIRWEVDKDVNRFSNALKAVSSDTAKAALLEPESRMDRHAPLCDPVSR